MADQEVTPPSVAALVLELLASANTERYITPERQSALLAGASALRSSAGLAASQELVDAVRMFLMQWAVVKPVIDGHAMLASLHGAEYSGPTIGNEITRLTAAFNALPEEVRQASALLVPSAEAK